MKTKTLKATSIIALVLEIICIVALLAYIVGFIMAIFSPNSISDFVKMLAKENHGELSVQGFDIVVLENDNVIKSAVIAFTLAGVLSFICRAMIFRNIHLILKTTAGKTWFSKGETPFQKDITRMIREIGIFYILIPVLHLILSIIFRPVIGTEVTEIGVRMEGVITGLVIIVLSQIFGYGEKLEDEVEGLV